MANAPDVLQDTLSLISDNWDSGSADAKTPEFVKITDFKTADFNQNIDWVIAMRPTDEMEPAGVGDSDKHEFANFNLDVRTLGATEETHWLNVIKEIKRILKLKKINPLPSTYSETHVLEFDGSGPDLSDKTHHLWRKLIPVQFKRYNIPR